MKLAYLDCASGISGDMTLGAMVDAGVSLAALQAGIDSLGLPSCELVASEVRKCGFRATQIVVKHDEQHAHRHLHHITDMIDQSELTERQQRLATDIFTRLAQAEANVHGTSIKKVHFHEVGAVDSIADIVGAAIGWDLLGVDQVVCSPIPTGTGFIQIAHGRCSVPAPATIQLLQGIPLADFPVEGELTTPTGAAIVATMVTKFGPMPAMEIEAIGYGAGQKDFDHANLLRLVIGTSTSKSDLQSSTVDHSKITLLETNIDDCTGEQVGHCIEQLWNAGALDVSTTAIQMKKNRPGVLLSVQVDSEKSEELANIIFQQTSTLGIRKQVVERITLRRECATADTTWGEVAGICATLPDGSTRFSPEYEACKAIAEKHKVPLSKVVDESRAKRR